LGGTPAELLPAGGCRASRRCVAWGPVARRDVLAPVRGAHLRGAAGAGNWSRIEQ